MDRLIVSAGVLEVSRDGDLTWVRARAEWTPAFDFHNLADPQIVVDVDPAAYTEGQHYLWAWSDEARSAVRSRMFAPAMGIIEDEATGAAAIALTARLGRGLEITQGRGSRITTGWEGEGWGRLGGRVVSEPPRTLRR